MDVLLNDPLSIAVDALGTQDLHVWLCPLCRYEAQVDRLSALLSSDEITRLRRFAFDRDRRRFLLSHGMLRVILAAYVGQAPERLRFHPAPQGKPFLVDEERRGHDLRFNLSHSGDYALVAVTRGREVGVDVEAIRADVHDLELAERFFAPGEARLVAEATGEERRRLFYRYWTAKEAFLKGRGVGLSDGLQRFEVLWDDMRTGRIRTFDGTGTLSPWQVCELALGQGLAGAVAVEGEDCRLHQYDPLPPLCG